MFLNYWLNKHAWFNPELSGLNKWWFIELMLSEEGKALFIKNHGCEAVTINNVAYYKKLNTKCLWYYAYLYKPKYVEAFPYSSTMLVWITQGWHFEKMLTFSVYEAIITYFIITTKFNLCGYIMPDVWYYYIPTFLGLKLIRFFGFSATYR